MTSTNGREGGAATYGDCLVESLLSLEHQQGLVPFLEACRTELESFRRSVDFDVWSEFVDSDAAATLRSSFLDDPYTRRGFEKPRGYAGDAVLLDYIYETTPLPDATSKRGSQIYRWMCKESHAFHAVRHRRALLAERIDSAIARKPSARILSIACGHLREFALCKFDSRMWRGELVALDQDPESLTVVSNTYHTHNIVPVRASIASLINGTAKLGEFDFIYAAGLLDYLDDTTAQSLTAWCRRSLARDGNILLANFFQCDERGFMESIMQWPLIYRDAQGLAALLQKNIDSAVTSFSDPLDVVVYSEAR